jgi:hypothetical protein
MPDVMRLLILFFSVFRRNIKFQSKLSTAAGFVFFVSKTVLSDSFFCSLAKLGSATQCQNFFAYGRLTMQNKQKLLGSATAFSCDKIKN